MAKTNLRNFTVQEKLNKMDVDYITVTPASAVADANNKCLYDTFEIPNAVAVPGGSCIIQSITATHLASADISHTIVILDSNLSGGTPDATMGNLSSSVISAVQGIVPMPDGTAIGSGDTVSSLLSIGMIAKAAEGSTSLFAFGISNAAAAITSAGMTLKFGIVKD